MHLFKRSSRRFLPFFDSADLCQLKGSLGAGKTGWPVVQLEVKWSQFSSSARKGSKVYWAANRLTIKNEDSCLAERCRGEAAADGLGIWQAVCCKGPRVRGPGCKGPRRAQGPSPRASTPVQGLGASSLKLGRLKDSRTVARFKDFRK